MMKPAELKAMRRHAGKAADMLRMLSHEARLIVLCELINGERSAGALVEVSGLGQSALSQHLAKLRESGLVTTRQEAQTVYYRLADTGVTRLIAVLHEIYCRS
jgi:ArsR family transcriptional regulator, virulence genes transcriptional regulator